MTEYDQLCRVLNKKFKSSSQDEMTETKGNNAFFAILQQ